MKLRLQLQLWLKVLPELAWWNVEQEIGVEKLLEFIRKENGAANVIDVRNAEEYRRGSFPGAVCIQKSELMAMDTEEDIEHQKQYVDGVLKAHGIEKNRTMFIFCHTGLISSAVTDYLRYLGLDAVNVAGGYRTLLRLNLEKIVQEDNKIKERRARIENSIVKKFHVPIYSQFIKAVKEYELVRDGDRIAVCISGGKDSMLLAKLMQELKRQKKVDFELKFLVMDPGYNPENYQIIIDNAKLLGIDIKIFKSEIFDIVAGVNKSPCYLCARMRRGYLYRFAKELSCNKIALGHHFDDVIETVLMGMFYSGQFQTMMPKLHSRNFPGMELIRPLYRIKEDDIKAWRDYNDLHFIQCACRFTENCATCGGSRGSKRDEMKTLIREMKKTNPTVDADIFRSITDINLDTVLGYHRDTGERHSFLDTYYGAAALDKETGEE